MRKIRISREEIRKRPLFVATPMYGGQCFGGYTKSIFQFKALMVENGWRMDYFAVVNESLIPRARNKCVHEFLKGDCTHFLFIDADIEFSPDDALSLLVMADPESEIDVVCGLYPKKNINWDRVEKAVRQGHKAGPEFASDLVFNAHDHRGEKIDFYSPLEVPECGSGFMMVQRRVFEKFKKTYPKLEYKLDDKKDGENVACIFDTCLIGNRYLSEDYNFCRLIRDMGIKVWILPWLELNHLGHYRFVGNPLALSTLAETINVEKAKETV